MSEDVVVQPVKPGGPMDPEAMFKSLTGFEEIAISEMFRQPAAKLAQAAEDGDPLPLMRALVFISLIREGSSRGLAFKTAMSMRADRVVERFKVDQEEEGKDESPTSDTPTSLLDSDSPSPSPSTSD